MIEKLIAKNNGVLLINHSNNVSIVANEIAKKFLPNNKYNKLYEIIRIASLLHDIGKIPANIQLFLRGKSKSKKQPYYHNEIGWAFLKKYLTVNSSDNKEFIVNMIYWHHGITNKMGDDRTFKILDTITDNDIECMKKFIIHTLGESYLNDKDNNSYPTPIYYKNGTDNDNDDCYNGDMTIIRSIIISSDRIVSEIEEKNSNLDLSKCGMDEILNKINEITSKKGIMEYNPSVYENIDIERFNIQCDIANKCDSTTVVKAPAGFGKTLTGLLWSAKSNKKLIWVCPRNVVVKSVYKSILDEIKAFKLDNTVSVELYLTGQTIEKSISSDGEFNSDIIVTNIDNLLAPTVNDRIASRLFTILDSDIVFDEYHEFLSPDAFFYGFLNIMKVRNSINTRTLLLSATPIYIEKMWDNFSKVTKYLPNKKTHYKAAHNKKYTIQVSTISKDDLISMKDDSSITIVNSIYNSQYFKSLSFDSTLYHSAFFEDKKNQIFDEMMFHYGKQSNINAVKKPHFITTLIAQASLDVSFKNMFESVLSPEFTMQRGGRTNRFGKYLNSTINIFKICNKDGLNINEKRVIEMFYNVKLMEYWYDDLAKHNGRQITLDELYEIYNKHVDKYSDKRYELFSDFKIESKKSISTIYPIRHFNPKEKSDIRIAGSNKLRSTSAEIFYIVENVDINGTRTNTFTDDVFSESVKNNMYKDIFKEDNKTFAKMKNSIKIIQKYNSNLYSDWDKKKLEKLSIDDLRMYAKFSDTPYIRFDEVYHPIYGLISTSKLSELNK